ncbi:hypothetical protein MVES_002269 [Malassezia vespertilionis]|uniref:FAD dependent oxidoreductase domain-containing protein n=1 Tax=Malassezia vespertilionis TaxID=2020962 RepID=A0A2N1JBM1_9BASI|nr:hypothetical protein MVES_002269 [Malassezia vespertilionis]
MAETKDVLVVGAGVLGLTCALELRKQGYRVTIVARDLPVDLSSQSFASPWAGANWLSFANTNEVERRRDAHSYKIFQQLTEVLPPHVLAFMPFAIYHSKKDDFDTYWFGQLCGGINTHDATPTALPSAPYLYEFRSLCLNVPLYLQWLVSKLEEDCSDFTAPPVRFVRAYLPSLASAASYFSDAKLIVNATGLGSQSLDDVRDPAVYPIRGQTVLVWIPQFRDSKYTKCYSSIGKHGAIYIIPRARSGEVVLGGTFDVRNTNSLLPNAAVTERILKDAVKVAPELLAQGVDPNSPDAWKSIKVLRENVGVRPAREGGARVELDQHSIQADGRTVSVIHAYGIGPAGYQASHGIASEVGQLANEWQRRSNAHL